MPTSPFATAQISVSGGGPQQGGLTVAGASTIQLSGTNTSNWTSARWEIYAYPSGWPTPAGWTLDATTGIIYSTSTTPTLITLEAATARWGKWLARLLVNGGTKNGVSPVFDPITGSYLPNDVIDIASGWEVVDPTLGLHEPALYESTQFGGLRRWVDPIQKSLHTIATLTGALTTASAPMANADVSLAATATNAIVPVSGLTANHTLTLPTTPFVGQTIEAPVTDGSLPTWGVVFNAGANTVQGPDGAGGATTAATWTMGAATGFGAYSSATVKWIGTAWRVM